ncbi:uncharacterized protein SPSC_06036 [Sporisorium scitamineum]|uniref:Pentatricopeptide repeat-containing protein-mitochondrial domain-containing protein n=1 Tax=Sporisorium scitamineum TaxID=49012 RepID=A0A0F7RVT7_9BASI|nr:hypothetical protein [Sporisorium scitamineum]CDU25865.1 uncharacterized protein SPSC_06036 [Sporisorium scitamineum]
MLRQARGSGSILLELLQLSRTAAATSESVSILPRPLTRHLATRSTHSAGKQRSLDDAQTQQSSPIYPNSKAAHRRNPHAPRLFQHFQRRLPGQDTPSSSKPSSQRASSQTYILRNVSTDPELKQLYTSLGMAADSHDAVQATRLCQLIKERKQHISGPSGKVSFEPEEQVVFLAVMRALAFHGLLEEVQAIHADMLSFGFDECIDSLNNLLQAAIVCGDEKATAATLESILALQPSTSSASERSEQLAKVLLGDSNSSTRTKAGRITGLTLPLEKMRNWTATTFAHVVESACQDHNFEYALLLLSTCYRLGLSLPHDTLSRLISLCLHCGEFRTALELADLMEQGGLVYRDPSSAAQAGLGKDAALRSQARGGQVSRRLPPSMWMSVLRSCAEGGYLPGVELAWSKAVIQGLQSPDDGLLQLILALAAKEGSAQMAQVCLRHIDPTFDASASASTSFRSTSPANPASARRVSVSKRMDLQEWHLAPLFEAQCSARDYQGAMRTLRAYHSRGFTITDRTTSRISTSIYPDKTALQLARDALTLSATDPAEGTHRAIVNAVLSAAVWLGDLSQALEIYHSMPTFHRFPAPEAPPHKSRDPITPNLDTFNSLLSGCIDSADYDAGVELLRDLNVHKIRPDVTTFERMVVLCLTQSHYDDAFGFIEEAKVKNILPSRKSYEALVRKCFREKDHRWESVMADMSDQGYRPSPRLLRELELDPDAYSSKPKRSRS